VKNILITGAAGYIGSHFAEFFRQQGYVVSGIDDYSSPTAKFDPFDTNPEVDKVSITNRRALRKYLKDKNFDYIIHLAAIKTVDQGLSQRFYNSVNFKGTKNLCKAVNNMELRGFFFASTAGVYGNEPDLEEKISKIRKDINKYAVSKIKAENYLIENFTDSSTSLTIFRFFNVAGTFGSGKIEVIPSNLIPIIINNFMERQSTPVYGTELETRDGSPIRDYIDVWDLAEAHRLMIERIDNSQKPTIDIFNLGTAKGTSVLEVIKMTEDVIGEIVKWDSRAPRPGDSIQSVADPKKFKNLVNWEPQIELVHMIANFWNKYIKLNKF